MVYTVHGKSIQVYSRTPRDQTSASLPMYRRPDTSSGAAYAVEREQEQLTQRGTNLLDEKRYVNFSPHGSTSVLF